MKFFRLENGIAVEKFIEKPIFHADLMKDVVQGADNVQLGWAYNASTGFSAPPPPLPKTKDELKSLAADKRFRCETGGVNVDATFDPDHPLILTIKSDRESQAMITGAVTLLNSDLALAEIDFKGADGFVTIPRALMLIVGKAVGRFVQKMFRKERDIAALIDAGTITTSQQIEDWTGWYE